MEDEMLAWLYLQGKEILAVKGAVYLGEDVLAGAANLVGKPDIGRQCSLGTC
jgi:hypothetical protein